MIQSIKSISKKFNHYTKIKDFEKNIEKHKHDLIMPLYYGECGYNQKNILPSICELYQLNYIGADAYTHTICNDKNLSKLYAKQFDIKSANSVLVYNDRQLKDINLKYLKLPLIIKPNFGGGSVGITDECLIYDYLKAKRKTKQMLYDLKIPILIEEYIEGYEVELIVLGNHKQIRFCKEVSLIIKDKQYFDKEIWGLETKKIDDSTVRFEISTFINKTDRENLLKLFNSFDKMEFARFDGRIKNGDFYLLEVSPDCYLGDDCAFYFAFASEGLTHSQMFTEIIKNHLD